MAETFVPGDVVILKSGGPKMTVESIGNFAGMGGPGARCKWFEKNDLKEAAFAISALKKAE